jgi:uncharacterized OB-fold protein
MAQNATNNGYTRCSECSHVYDSTQKSCPKCGTKNVRIPVELNEGILNESYSEPVFNLLD